LCLNKGVILHAHIEYSLPLGGLFPRMHFACLLLVKSLRISLIGLTLLSFPFYLGSCSDSARGCRLGTRFGSMADYRCEGGGGAYCRLQACSEGAYIV
jgi:hypothetical protein